MMTTWFDIFCVSFCNAWTLSAGWVWSTSSGVFERSSQLSHTLKPTTCVVSRLFQNDVDFVQNDSQQSLLLLEVVMQKL